VTQLMPIVLAVVLASVPIIAVIGGIVAAVLRVRGRQRLLELAYRERIAALERGIDPATLPPVIPLEGWDGLIGNSLRPTRMARPLLVGGVLLTSFGIGLGLVMALIEPGQTKWIVGIIPVTTGAGLFICERILRARR